MKILVINGGSSTIKFQLYNMDDNSVLAKGKCDKLGQQNSVLMYKNLVKGESFETEIYMPTHKEGMKEIIRILTDKEQGVLKSFDELYAVGHRIVHGGERFNKAEYVTEDVLAEIDALSDLAPLHNPGAVIGIKAIKELAPTIPNVTVFDTAFHQTIPSFNYLYAIDYKYYEQYGIRKYGFHGTSYMYILKRLEEMLQKPKEKINAIVCHLGGGASICAIKDGKSYDTSMGFTPLEGLVMETRCGDIDAAVICRLMEKENLEIKQINEILNKKSGRLGLSGIGDHRELVKAAEGGDPRADLTLKIQTNRIKKYIGSYLAQLGRVDVIAFTGGIGENNAGERRASLKNMEMMGIVIEPELNETACSKEMIISAEHSNIAVAVVPTNEELEIAIQTLEVLKDCVNNG